MFEEHVVYWRKNLKDTKLSEGIIMTHSRLGCLWTRGGRITVTVKVSTQVSL